MINTDTLELLLIISSWIVYVVFFWFFYDIVIKEKPKNKKMKNFVLIYLPSVIVGTLILGLVIFIAIPYGVNETNIIAAIKQS
ncbi:hypothetical protein [Staphylococcus saprophyticus]|uniref:hypothetical protein n=1 Tax=Staphylococcus saprophyticus TaxID=29385 RepID=UPI0011A5BFC9|nr:hypothetical protein [Staphylococcus saprophyticus]